MRPKKSLLNQIGGEFALNVDGMENYDSDKPSLIVANHTCMKDIFSLPAALPEACQIVLSSRLMWKRNNDENARRRKIIEESLYGIPLEVHGGKQRLQVGLEMAKRALIDGWSVVIFPEGAYINEGHVSRGRTGAARILFGARQAGVDVNLLPVGIDNKTEINDLDDFTTRGDSIDIKVGAPIYYDEYFDNFMSADSPEQVKTALHSPVDIAMRSIAKSINRDYKNEYIELRPRSTIILETGEEIAV